VKNARQPLTDLIVLVPGVMGSVLRRDGKDLWATTAGAMFGALSSLGGTVASLKLDSETGTDDDAGDGITAPSLLQDLHAIPGFWKIDGYTRAKEHILERFEATPGENFFEFPYDWRRDNRHHARRLKRESAQWLDAWRSRPGHRDAKLVLVAHSMGGLVSRYFVEVLGGWRDTRALVTFGTPHLGAAKVMKTLVDGIPAKLGPFSLADMTGALRSFTSVWQLLPVYASFDAGDGKLVRLSDTTAHGLDLARVHAGRDFHREIRDAATKNAADADYRASGFTTHCIVGVHQPTLQSAAGSVGSFAFHERFEGRDEGGDGSVPRLSAVPAKVPVQTVLVPEQHASLQNTDFALLQLEGILRSGWAPALDDALSFAPGHHEPSPVKLRVDDSYAEGDDVVVRAKPDDASVKLRATVTGVQGAKGAELELVAAEDGWHEARVAGLGAGAWRVAVGGGGGGDGDGRDVRDVRPIRPAVQCAARHIRATRSFRSRRVLAYSSASSAFP
jgi:hypothetical protein